MSPRRPTLSPRRPKMSPRRPQEAPNGPQEGTQGGPGPPKRAPKEPQKAMKNRNAQKYRKIRCFILENGVFARFGCIFEPISSAKPVFFCFPRTKTPYFTRQRGGKKAKNPKICVFAREAVLQDVSRFLGGRGLAKSRKITFSRGRCGKDTKITYFSIFWDPPGPKSS